MFFFFKKPTVTIDAFVADDFAFVVEYAPIQKASKFLPEWFKSLPNEDLKSYLKKPIENNERNAKGCVGILNSLMDGFIIPFWSDLRIDWNSEGYRYKFSDRISSLSSHPNHQAAGFLDNYWIFKIDSPWILSCSRNLRVTHLPLTYHHGLDCPIKTLHGIQNSVTSKEVITTNNFYLAEKKSEIRSHIFNFNQPYLQLSFPNEYNYKINCHVDSEKHLNLFSINKPITFFRKGLKQKIFDRKNKK